MLRRFRLWLHQFNPIALWRDERRLDREAKLEMVHECAEAMRAQADVAIKALDLATKFLKSFEVSGNPDSYVVRNEDEVKTAALRYGLNPEEFTSENNPFTYIS